MIHTRSLVLCLVLFLSVPRITYAHYPRASPVPYRLRESRCLRMSPLICNVMPTNGHATSGKVIFSAVWMQNAHGWHDCYVRIQANVTGLSNNKHGFHIHEFGDLSLDDGSSTGAHFNNPRNISVMHGFSCDIQRHWGDMDNLEPNEEGVAIYDRVDAIMTLQGIVGRAVTIHIGEDKGPDFQPSGAAGARIGFCVIGFANTGLL